LSVYLRRQSIIINFDLRQDWIFSKSVDSNAPARRLRSGMVSMLAIFLVAATARSALLVIAVDVPGDGPSREFEAYDWSRSPHWVSYGTWLPGLIYFRGVASILVPNPAIAVRLVNAVAGALTAAVVFAYVRQLYGSRRAWVAAAVVSSVLSRIPDAVVRRKRRLHGRSISGLHHGA
jgi:hypothetical protein